MKFKRFLNWAKLNNVRIARTNVWEEGGKGGMELAKQVLGSFRSKPKQFAPLYELSDSIEEKITTIVQKVYGGNGVEFYRSSEKTN